MAVGVAGRVEQDKTRQETLQVQSQMTLGRGLAPAMPGPVQTGGDEFDRGRIDDVNGAGEAPGPAAARPPIQGRTEAAQMSEHFPEQGLGQGGVAFLVGVREAVPARRGGPAQARERPGVQAQAVTDIVETDGVNELGIEQRHDMTPVTEGASELFRAEIAGQLGDEVGRNEMAKLPEHGQLGTGWRTLGFLFHLDRVAENLAFANLFLHHL